MKEKREKGLDLKERVEELEGKLKEVENEYLLKLAELENSRKRLEKEYERSKELANERIILGFLDVLDNLERALNYEGDIREGVEMTRSQIVQLLKNEGVSDINEKEFNPELHYAISVEKSDRDGIEEIRRGYLFKGKVIRPSLVKLLEKEN